MGSDPAMSLKWDPREEDTTVGEVDGAADSVLASADLQFDFTDLLGDLRGELQNLKEQEEKIASTITHELRHLKELYGCKEWKLVLTSGSRQAFFRIRLLPIKL